MINKRRALTFGAVAAGAAVAGFAGWRWRSTSGFARLQHDLAAAPAPSASSVAAFWSMRFERPEGGAMDIAALRGQPLLLNFWATWCPPCVTELPMIDRFHQAHQAAGWRVIGLAIDSPTPVREFLKTRPLSFGVGLAGLEGIELTRSLGNPSGALPFSVVFGRDGTVRERKLGSLTDADLDRYLTLA